MKSSIDHYKLDSDHRVEPCDIEAWITWREANDIHVRKTDLPDCWVSTVFLGLDHQYDDGPPLVFETMVFEKTGKDQIDWHGGECHRYSSWDDAVTGHDAVVSRLTREGVK